MHGDALWRSTGFDHQFPLPCPAEGVSLRNRLPARSKAAPRNEQSVPRRLSLLGILDNIRASITSGGSKSMFHTIVLLRLTATPNQVSVAGVWYVPYVMALI